MKSYATDNTIPWYQAHISGFVLDPDRKKMSKSKGNVITPINLIEKYSADAVRYWAGRARLGIDATFEEKVMDQGKKLCNKFFNASKFVFNIVAGSGIDVTKDYISNITSELDRAWIAKMSACITTARRSFGLNDYAGALEATEKLFWDFCDNYLEIVKGRAYGTDNVSAVSSLMLSIDLFCLMFAPFLVFITEEVYQARPWGSDTNSIHIKMYPNADSFASFGTSCDMYNAVVSIVEKARKAKSEQQKSLKTPVLSLVVCGRENDLKLVSAAQTDLKNVLNIADDNIKYEIKDEDLDIANLELGE